MNCKKNMDSKYKWRSSQKIAVRRWKEEEEEEEEDQRKTSKMIAYLKVKVKIVKEKMQCFVKGCI